MNQKLWREWASQQGRGLADQPWLLSKWETLEGVSWPEEKIALMIEDIAAKLELRPALSLLDVGCGSGWISRRLRPRVQSATALDFSPDMIALAIGSGDLTAVLADAQVLPFREASFDRVLVYFMLMNFTEPAAIISALREGLRLLTPGGRLLAGQMPLSSRREIYDREKRRYLEYCREKFKLGADLAGDHAPPIALFDDDYDKTLERELRGTAVTAHQSFNHFYRPGEPTLCSWRVDYLLHKIGPRP